MPYGVPPGLRTFTTENTAGPASAGANAFGSRNTLLGFRAGEDIGDPAAPNASDDVVAIGVEAAENLKADSAIAIGRRAARGIPAGMDRVLVIGNNAMSFSPFVTPAADGAGTMVIGHNAAQNLDALLLLPIMVIGNDALANVDGDLANAHGLTAIGNSVLNVFSAATLSRNTLIGHGVCESLSAVVNQNTAIGYHAMRGGPATSNIQNNVAIGPGALQALTIGTDNVAIGGASVTGGTLIFDGPLDSVTSGVQNIGIGSQVGIGLTTGSQNTLVGVSAGQLLTSHSDNVFIGRRAGDGIAGSRNTVLGHFGGDQTGLTNDYVLIGAGAGFSGLPVNADNFLVENNPGGPGTFPQTLLYGRFDTGSIVIGTANNVGGVPINRDVDAATMTNGVKILDGVAPTANPTGGGFLYVTAGALNYRGSAGTVTAIAPA